MPRHVLLIDLFSLMIAIVGFFMAFHQVAIRRFLGSHPAPGSRPNDESHSQEPLTYALRIAGIMLMGFGVALGGMITMYNLA